MRDIKLVGGNDVGVYPGAGFGDGGQVGGFAFVARWGGGAVANGEERVEGAGYGEPFWVVLKGIPGGRPVLVVGSSGRCGWWVFEEMLFINGMEVTDVEEFSVRLALAECEETSLLVGNGWWDGLSGDALRAAGCGFRFVEGGGQLCAQVFGDGSAWFIGGFGGAGGRLVNILRTGRGCSRLCILVVHVKIDLIWVLCCCRFCARYGGYWSFFCNLRGHRVRLLLVCSFGLFFTRPLFDSSELPVHMCREPVRRPQPVHHVLSCHTAQRSVQTLLFPHRSQAVQPLDVAELLDLPRPVVAQSHVHLLADLQQFAHIKLPDMVKTLLVGPVEGQPLVMRLAVVHSLPDAAQPGNPQRAQPQHVGRAHVVDIGCDPTTVVQLRQMGRSLVVAPDEDGQVGGLAGAAVVLVVVAQGAVLGGHGHDLDIVAVADGLEVAADDEQVDAGPLALGAGFLDGGVDGVESSMALMKGIVFFTDGQR